MRSPLAILAALALVASAQQTAPPASSAAKPGAGGASGQASQGVPRGPVAVIKVSSHLVVEDVYVNDKDGKPIPGLQPKDFAVTEDNIPQAISVFRYEKIDDANAPPPEHVVAAATPTKVEATVGSSGITPETQGKNRYDNRRLLVLYFDMTTMQVPEQLRALDYAQQFVKKQMRPADMMAILLYDSSGAVRVKQDFTDDKDALQTCISNIIVGTDLGMDESSSDAASADTGTGFGQDDSEFNIFTTNRQLAAMQTAVNMLSSISEKKVFVYFSSGLNLNGVDNQAQLTATTNSAVKAGVQFWPVDARGLIASPPMGDASAGNPGGASMYNGSGSYAFAQRMYASQDTLYALASDTGGKAIFDNNDLGQGIVQAEKSISDYYIIGYYTSNQALDGKYRRIKIGLADVPSAKLAYRVGYYAGKEFAKFTEADKERQLEDALLMGDPITDLTIDAEINYFQIDSANYFVPIAAKIPGRELALAKHGGAERTQIDYILEVKDEYGTTMTNLRDFANVKLTDETAAQLAKSPVEINTGLTVLPGKYTLKVLARDAETGRIGTYIKTFVIPNLNPDRYNAYLPISSVVLSSQRSPLAAAVFNAKKDTSKDAAQANNPLVQNGVELEPSVTHVFSQQKPFYVYLQAYERDIVQPAPAASGNGAKATSAPAAPAIVMRPLIAYVSFIHDGHEAFKSTPQEITDGFDPKTRSIPISFNFALDKLAVGQYLCQVTVIDPTAKKFAVWDAPIMILQ